MFSLRSARPGSGSHLCARPTANAEPSGDPRPSEVIIHLNICLPRRQELSVRCDSVFIHLCFPVPAHHPGREGNTRRMLIIRALYSNCLSIRGNDKLMGRILALPRHKPEFLLLLFETQVFFFPLHGWLTYVTQGLSVSTSCPRHVCYTANVNYSYFKTKKGTALHVQAGGTAFQEHGRREYPRL